MGITFADKPCLDPQALHRDCAAIGWPTHLWAGKANQFRSVLGPAAGRGWLLMRRGDIDALDLNQLHDLVFTDDAGRKVTIKQTLFVKGTCVTPGVQGSANRAYLVEVTDWRWLAQNPYWDNPFVKNYNVLAPASPQQYYLDSLNSDLPWDWQQMLDDIWDMLDLSDVTGPAPFLPFNAPGLPENWRFLGVPLWQAFNEVLGRLSAAFAHNPIKPTENKIVKLGEEDAGLAAVEKELRPLLIDDEDIIEPARANAPAQVKVYFHKAREHYGTEKSTGWDAGEQDAMDPLKEYTITDSFSTPGTQSGSTGTIFDDYTALVAFDGTVTNEFVLSGRADERALDFFRRVNQGRNLRRTYAGWHADTRLLPGRRVSGIAWSDLGHGMKTEIVYVSLGRS